MIVSEDKISKKNQDLYIPILRKIRPNPSMDGKIKLYWKPVQGALHYDIFYNSVPFTKEDTAERSKFKNRVKDIRHTGIYELKRKRCMITTIPIHQIGMNYFMVDAHFGNGKHTFSECEPVDVRRIVPFSSSGESRRYTIGALLIMIQTLVIIVLATQGILDWLLENHVASITKVLIAFVVPVGIAFTWNYTMPIEKIVERLPPPVIIGHNCGYQDFYISGELYSKEATTKCMGFAHYLEMDIDKVGGAWRCFHIGKSVPVGWEGSKENEIERYNSNRFNGVSLHSFLKAYKQGFKGKDGSQVINESGLFLDMKGIPWGGGNKKSKLKRLVKSFDAYTHTPNFKRIRLEVKDLMDTIYKSLNAEIVDGTTIPYKKPFKTNLMIYPGWYGPNPSDPQAVAAFLFWIGENRQKMHEFNNTFPRITIVTRSNYFQNVKKIKNLITNVNAALKSEFNARNEKPGYCDANLSFVENGLNQNIFWGFNPDYITMRFHRHFTLFNFKKLAGIVVPWSMDAFLDKDNDVQWRFLMSYMFGKGQLMHDFSKVSWGIITYKPAEFLEQYLAHVHQDDRNDYIDRALTQDYIGKIDPLLDVYDGRSAAVMEIFLPDYDVMDVLKKEHLTCDDRGKFDALVDDFEQFKITKKEFIWKGIKILGSRFKECFPPLHDTDP